jgi:hypothetical protein
MNTVALQQPRFEQGTITVDRIFPAKAQGKSANIKDTSGLLFGVWPDKLGLFNVGETYEIEFSSKVSNGVTYRDIKTAKMVARSEPPSLQSGATRTASPPGAPSGQYFRPTSPKDARRMFICSQMNALITSHQVQVSAQGIADSIVMLADAYDATLGRED